MIIWLIGLSGAGKSTIGQALYKDLKKKHRHTVLIDGDEIREMFRHNQHTEAYSLEGRRINAERIHDMCAWLDSQDIHVVCCILSIFQEISDINKKRFSQYFEVYVDTPLKKLIEKDGKGLYNSALKGEIKNVVGIDLEYTPPKTPNLVIKNNMQKNEISKYVDSILFGIKELHGHL